MLYRADCQGLAALYATQFGCWASLRSVLTHQNISKCENICAVFRRCVEELERLERSALVH